MTVKCIMNNIQAYRKYKSDKDRMNKLILTTRETILRDILQSCEPNYDFTPHIYDVVETMPEVAKDVLIDLFFLAHS